MRSVKVGAVVVSYGPSSPAREAVRSLLEGDLAPEYIVVVNNGPEPLASWTDARGMTVSDLSVGARPRAGVTLIDAPRNVGYAGGLRLGVAALDPVGLDYLWLLNNDIVVHAGALAALVAAGTADPGVGVWGGTLCSDKAFTTVEAVGVRYSPWTTRRHQVLAGMPVIHAQRVPLPPRIDFVVGASMFMPLDAYGACGGIPTEYFMYYEELDLVARLRSAGRTVGWCREALIAHGGGLATGASNHRRPKSPAVSYHSMRSAIIFTRRHAPLALPSVVLSRMVWNVGFEALLGSRLAAHAAAKGCLDGLAFAPGRGRS